VIVLRANANQTSIAFRRTALIIVDMQIAFASEGGMFDLAEFDICGAARAIEDSLQSFARCTLTAAGPQDMMRRQASPIP
jgi:hypothetical protein